jgi:hypothetical protein
LLKKLGSTKDNTQAYPWTGKSFQFSKKDKKESGGESGNRIRDLVHAKHTLYQLSLKKVVSKKDNKQAYSWTGKTLLPIFKDKTKKKDKKESGGESGNRIRDLVHAKHTLYQLSFKKVVSKKDNTGISLQDRQDLSNFQRQNKKERQKKKVVENLEIESGTLCMLSTRSTN